MEGDSPNVLKHCPKCGGKHFKAGDFKPWKCSDCGFVLYQNTAAATAALILNGKGQLLLVKRAKEPAKGKWDLPGGFIDDGETAEAALRRECEEETGAKIESLYYLCNFPNTYPYGDLTYHTLDFYFTATLAPYALIQPLDEVTQIDWFDIDSIEMESIAFGSCRKAIQCLKDQLAC